MPQATTADELIALGLEAASAESIAAKATRAWQMPPVEAWRVISKEVLLPEHPFDVHRLLFTRTFSEWAPALGPPPAWTPRGEEARQSNAARLMAERGLASIADLHRWSADECEAFWAAMVERLGIRLATPYRQFLDMSDGVEQARWLVGARMNIADSCFQAEPSKLAIEYHDELGAVRRVTYGELEALVNRVAGGLVKAGFRPGDAVAIDMPMSIEAVAGFLGIIRAGCIVVAVADSLAADEIAVRLRLGNAKGVLTQETILRGGKQLPLYARVAEAGAPRTIVVTTSACPRLRPGDLAWSKFLVDDDRFAPHLADPEELTGVLFSSGTTGEPKAIVWNHTTPIRAVLDGYLHQDIQPHDRVAWPTNLGWVMGSWLVYATFVNRATMALYGGAPTGRDFGRFVTEAGVTMLGVIPSLVKTWRGTDCMSGLDWSRVTRFSSTGECSNVDDMLYLMSLAGYKPVIEYCGGTELGGGYIASTMAQPNAPSTFTTPCFGVDFMILDESGAPADEGEVFLVPPSIGMSTRLLHHDHHEVYYAEAPASPDGQPLRRHGDALVRLRGGYYRAVGRVDDTMNLGGIKVSSVEIERVLNTVSGVRETAAVAVNPPGGGPSTLWVFAVLNEDAPADDGELAGSMQAAIRKHLSPLFKIQKLVRIEAMPRTASNKIMRRLLRDQAVRETKK